MENHVFRAIEQKKVSSQIVDQVKSLIANGRLKPGDTLPPERELMKVFNVSRPTLREALNMLSIMGFIQVSQRQRTRVKSLVPCNITEPLRHLLQEDRATSLELIEARTIIETANAELAAKRATEKDIKKLCQIKEAMKTKVNSGDSVTDLDADFHLAIAEATHNKIQTHLMFSLYDLLREKVAICYYDDEADHIMEQHAKVIEFIINKKPAAARKAMEDHLMYIKSLVNRLIDSEK